MADAARHPEVLEERHRVLDDAIDDAQRGHVVDPVRLSWMKRQRLALRDAIERLRNLRRAKT